MVESIYFLKPAWCGTHFAGLWPEQGLQPVTRATALRRWFVTPNYGERYRHGERISTAFAESTVNQVVSKRMVKKQQMAWTERGAHLLLQVRTRVLNGDLEETFRRWYPQFRSGPEQQPLPLKAAA